MATKKDEDAVSDLGGLAKDKKKDKNRDKAAPAGKQQKKK